MLSTPLVGRKPLAGGLAACSITLFSVSAVLAGPKGAAGDLYVANEGGNAIVQVDSATGAVVGDFATDGLNLPFDARFGPNGNLYVVNLGSGSVTEQDGNTGALVGTVVSGLSVPSGIRFDADGNILVYEAGNGDILKFDTSGNPLGTFASGLGGDDAPLDFGPDGNLYVSNWGSGTVDKFGPDGTNMGVFASGGGLSGSEGHVFGGPNGNLFVSSFISGQVIEFDGTDGSLVGTFIGTNLVSPTGIAFGPDGNLWVANFGSTDINEFDGTTGAFIQQVLGFSNPLSITVKPGGGPSDCLTMTVSALAGGQNGQWDVSGATAGSLVAVVYGLQAGSTVVNGQADFCATFGIQGVNQSRLVGAKIADGSGNVSIVKGIPAQASGVTVLTQAAERGTCPDECVSGVDTQTIG